MEPTQTPAPAAPAQPAPASQPDTQSAAHAAVASGDVSAYQAARRAERLGKPLPAVPVAQPKAADAPAPEAKTGEPPAAPAPPAPPAVSKRQQDINERARRAADAATAQLREENDRLRAQLAARGEPRPEAPAAPAPPAPKTWQDTLKAPDISQDMLSEEQFFQQFPDAPYSAYARYAVGYDISVREAEAHQRAQAEQLTASQQQRVETFVGRLDAASAADPEFVNKLTPEVKALRPFSAVLPGEPSGPLNVVAEQVYDSPIADKVLLHFSQHPEDLKRFETIPPGVTSVRAHIQWIVREFNKLEGQLEAAATPPPATPAPKTLTDAPEPVQTLGSKPAEATDPKASAIRRGDVRAYREIRRAERAAAMRR